MGVRWGGGLGASFSASGWADAVSLPFSFAGAEELAGEELKGLVEVDDGDAAKSLSVSIGWSAMTDIRESLRSSSGGRFSGCESRSCFFLEGLEKGFEGDGFLERVLVVVVVVLLEEEDFGALRLSRSLSREREEIEGFFSGEAGGAGRGEEGGGRCGVGVVVVRSSSAVFFLLNIFIGMVSSLDA